MAIYVQEDYVLLKKFFRLPFQSANVITLDTFYRPWNRIKQLPGFLKYIIDDLIPSDLRG